MAGRDEGAVVRSETESVGGWGGERRAQTAIRQNIDGKMSTRDNGGPESKKKTGAGNIKQAEMKNVSRTDSFSCGEWWKGTQDTAES